MGDRSARKHFKFLFTACFCFVSLSLGSLLLALGRHATQTIRSNRRRPFSLAVTGEKEHTPPLKLACDGICASAESGAAPVPSIHKRARNEQQQEVRSSGKHHDTTTIYVYTCRREIRASANGQRCPKCRCWSSGSGWHRTLR